MKDWTLEERMARFVKGQATWPDLNRRERCDTCALFRRMEKPNAKGDGACAKTKALTRREGAPYFGGRAIACSFYEPAGWRR